MGDDLRYINLFKFPCPVDYKEPKNRPQSRSYKAHSEHVINNLFDDKDEYLYTVGGEDRTLLKWKIIDIDD